MKLIIGIDVSKNTLDINFGNSSKNNIINVPNTKAGLTKFYNLLQQKKKSGNKIALAVCEATGGYETKLVKFSKEKNLPLHVAHAKKVRDFAKSKGLLAKTDKIDSYLLSEYGKTMNIQPNTKQRTNTEERLIGLLKRREQLKTDKVREMLRLDKDLDSSFKKSIKAHIRWLEKAISNIDKEIKSLQESDEQMKNKIKLLKSIPSIGDITASLLVAFLPELSDKTDPKKLSALVGLAPFAKDSGKYAGKRFIKGGRTILRNALYMSAISSIRHYKEMKRFYLKLRSRGKTAKMALIAVARKLLTVVSSIMNRQTVWQESPPAGV